MATQVVLLVGTRKGCFILESDEDRRDWDMRGPFCDGWPIYNAAYDAESGTIYAAAASEWHGAGIWRSADLGETWQLSSEGLGYGEDGELRLSKVTGLMAAHGRVIAGAEAAGLFESRDGGATWSLMSTLDGQPGRDDWNKPENQPPGHLGMAGLLPDPGRRRPLLGDRAGLRHLRDDGQRRLVDAAQPRPAGRLAAREPRDRLLRPQARDVAGRPRPPLPAEPLRHAPLRRRRPLVDRDHRGAAVRLRLRRGGAPARPRQLLRDPARPRATPAACRTGTRRSGAPSDAGGTWRRLDAGLPQRNAHLGVLREGMAIDDLDSPGLYFGTSTGPGVRKRRRGRELDARSRATCPASPRSRWR